MSVEDYIELATTRGGAFWTFDCPICGDRVNFLRKQVALEFAERHVPWCQERNEARARVP